MKTQKEIKTELVANFENSIKANENRRTELVQIHEEKLKLIDEEREALKIQFNLLKT